ncbi:MAG: beta-galactosidase [Lachnospiraceae bacterium]|nr:beta-galactosidase [Lachnospiraceae bacterium]
MQTFTNTEQTLTIPRPEHPKPQFYRDSWRNLNGLWDFDFDFGDSGKARGWADRTDYPHRILVPFCPESKLSGIGYTDFMDAVWYHRTIFISAEELQGRVLLHFGAVDYRCEVFVNGKSADTHTGGYTSFSFDITELLTEGENSLTVYAADDVRTHKQPAGKQCSQYASYGCYYTRTTGIWQTVWLEFVPKTYMTGLELIPDPDNSCAHLKICTNTPILGQKVHIEASLRGTCVGSVTVNGGGSCTMAALPLSVKELWEPNSPSLYDLTLTLMDGDQAVDTVNSYFGLRSIALKDGAILLNNKPVFQKLVLDQGFYPEGIYTAPSDEALKRDIELAQALGFNGARLHEKVFEERYLYWADKLGYMVWGEYPNWGLNASEAEALCTYLPEWLEAVKRDFNHPAIVAWCPFNETWDFQGHRQEDRVLSGIYLATKAADATRPVVDTSGNYHVMTDIFDVHNYLQDPEKLASFADSEEWYKLYDNDKCAGRQTYKGQPYHVSEYGGTWWNAKDAAAMNADSKNRTTSWGYGNRPRTEMEAATRIAALTKALLDDPKICGLCYTQIYDVEQEQNGLYYYDRTPKFSEEAYEIIRKGFEAPAAIEACK